METTTSTQVKTCTTIYGSGPKAGQDCGRKAKFIGSYLNPMCGIHARSAEGWGERVTPIEGSK